MHDLFVYGTMLRGMRNHWRVEDSEFLGEFKTALPYKMTVDFWRSTNHPVPYVSRAGRTARIRGELYRVDAATLKMIDRYEGHPQVYRRERVKVFHTLNGETVSAWVYFCEHKKGPFIVNHGDFFRFVEKEWRFLS